MLNDFKMKHLKTSKDKDKNNSLFFYEKGVFFPFFQNIAYIEDLTWVLVYYWIS